MNIESTHSSSGTTSAQGTDKRSTQAVCLSAAELVALAETGMQGFDTQVAEKTAAQRRDVGALRTLSSLKAKLQQYQKGLDNSDKGDKKRAGEKTHDADKVGKHMRFQQFDELRGELQKAIEDLPPEYKGAAREALKTMDQKGLKNHEFDGNQASRMIELLDGANSDITTRSQVQMAEINNLISQRSNMVEMTKNIATALSGQQEGIARNAPR